MSQFCFDWCRSPQARKLVGDNSTYRRFWKRLTHSVRDGHSMLLALEENYSTFLKPWPNDRNMVNATYRNIVGRNMLRAFGQRVAMCCNMLGVVGSSLKLVKFAPTTPNMSQHVATRWPNSRNMLRPTMLRYVVHVAIVCPGL